MFRVRPTPRQLVKHLLNEGRLKEALVRASTSPDASVRGDYRRLVSVLAGEPLNRPPLEPVHDPQSGIFGLHEVTGEGASLPVDRTGSSEHHAPGVVGRLDRGA